MKKLHWTADDVFNLPGIPDWAKYAIINVKLPYFFVSKSEPIVGDSGFDFDDDNSMIKLEHDYTGDWKDSLLERPVKIEVGQFGKFWCKLKGPLHFLYGYLVEIDETRDYKYRLADYAYFYNFEPIDPASLPKVRGEK